MWLAYQNKINKIKSHYSNKQEDVLTSHRTFYFIKNMIIIQCNKPISPWKAISAKVTSSEGLLWEKVNSPFCREILATDFDTGPPRFDDFFGSSNINAVIIVGIWYQGLDLPDTLSIGQCFCQLLWGLCLFMHASRIRSKKMTGLNVYSVFANWASNSFRPQCRGHLFREIVPNHLI